MRALDRTLAALSPDRALAGLARRSVRRPWRVLAIALALAAASLAWAAGHLPLRTSNLDLIDPELPAVRRFRELAREFGTPNVLIVVLEGGDGEALDRSVDRLVPRIARAPGVRSVFGRLPLPPGVRIDPYLSSRDGGLRFLFVQPDDPDSRAETLGPFVEAVHSAVRSAIDGDPGAVAPGVTVGYTGLPQYALDDQRAVRRDLARLSPLSFVLVLALFAGAFKALRRPLAAMVALGLAVAVVCGLASLFPGHLTLLSAFFGSILFGLGIDFGIHLVDRVDRSPLITPTLFSPARGDEGAPSPLRSVRDPGPVAIAEAVDALAAPLATGALTTASAFLTLTLSGFRGFAELGWIAAVGVLVALVSTVTVLPALLVVLPSRTGKPRRSREPIGAALVRLQHPALALLLVAFAALAPLALRPSFDSDYLDLEPRGSEAVRWEREMVDRSSYSTQFAAFVAPSREVAGELAARLSEEETVGEVHWAGELPVAPAETDGSTPWAPLAARFVSPEGRHAVYAHPRGNAWDPAVRDRFLDRMEALDPEVTGMPVLGRFMIDRSLSALRRAVPLAALVVFLWVLADLRDLRLALLALSPAALSLGALSALMALLGIDFNPLDVLALPVVIGIAVDDGVHLVHRFRAEGGSVEATLRGTGRSVVLTSATSLAAFGTLAAASHRGLASFAQVLALGVGAALAISVLALPWALARWGRRGLPVSSR